MDYLMDHDIDTTLFRYFGVLIINAKDCRSVAVPVMPFSQSLTVCRKIDQQPGKGSRQVFQRQSQDITLLQIFEYFLVWRPL